MASKQDKAINNIKMLGIDMIDKAGSGHPGIVLGAAPIIYSLYVNSMNVLAKKPNWVNRDRFILSCGHASALLYSMLFYAGYDYSIEDLERYRSVDSFTPGHPELNVDLGIECSTGLLGQGVANAVGVALAERYFENICKSYDKKSKLIDYYTYVMCSDGDLQEGIAYEALSFASKQNLNKLIVVCDKNNVQLDGNVKDSFTEELEDRFDALDFNVSEVKNNISDITSALKDARKSKRPSIIFVNTKIGKDSKWEGTNKCHGRCLEKDDISALKQKYGLSLDSFVVDETLKNYVTDTILKRTIKKYDMWKEELAKVKTNGNKKLLDLIAKLEKGEFYLDFDSNNYKIKENYCEEGRISNNKVLNFIAPKTKYFVGGSADLASSTKTVIKNSRLMDEENPTGRNIAFGVREHAMGGILNGMALSGMRVFGSTYLAFSDYLKPAMRMSGMMQLPVTYIFSHDSITNSYDGPTHEPIEQLTALRTIPGMLTFRPADINELIGCWEYMLNSKQPASLVINKDDTNIIKHTNGKYVQYGAYIVRKEKFRLDGIIIATGSEVNTALRVAKDLFDLGHDLRVVSMPCMELFLKQKPIYEEKLLPKNVKTITIEAGSTMLWNRFATDKDFTIGIDKFGVSGSKEETLKFMQFDYNTILMKIKNLLEK